MKTISLISWFLAATTGLLITTGCTEKTEGLSSGKITVSITDAPFNIDLIESAEITVSEILLKAKNVSDTVPFILLSDDEVTIDLMKLRNGVVKELVSIEIPAGQYDRINLITKGATLKLKTGEVFEVKIPSGSQSGIKINISPAIVVETSLSADVLLDADLSKSFVLKGNPVKPGKITGFNFKPVIRAANLSKTGTISGKVTGLTLNPLLNASVSLMKDTVITTTFTAADGHYSLPGISPGTYKMYAKKENYDSLVFEGVRVIEGNVTVRNFALKQK